MDKNNQFHEFDVVKIKKIHANTVFRCLNKGINQIDFTNKKMIKERPAIIIKRIGSIYIVLPLTTKQIKDSRAHTMLRTPFKNKNFSYQSYLMFDSLLRLQDEQIEDFYTNHKKAINFSESTKN